MASPGKAQWNGGMDGITKITVSGYKSIGTEQSIEVRPLTILAGANSSGKSSIMQPVLLLKQTLEASYDPGPLLLDGPNVRFASANEMFSRVVGGRAVESFSVGISLGPAANIASTFVRRAKMGLLIKSTTYSDAVSGFELRQGMSHEEIVKVVPESHHKLLDYFVRDTGANAEWAVSRNRCFLILAVKRIQPESGPQLFLMPPLIVPAEPFLTGIIHLPGLRGNPERTYPVTAVGGEYPGTFEKYAASVIAQWDAGGYTTKLQELGRISERLGLTWKITAKRVSDTRVELKVGRLAHSVQGGAYDLVSVADVGFGVSQSLPILVALLAARPGQLVYLEQPEIHLHPKAQLAMARLLAEAANRGVRVVAETHSALLLLGLQSAVAQGHITPDKVKLHWFERNQEDGSTKVTSRDLDDSGAFGDWPEDFAETELKAQNAYLDAAEAKHLE
jgi:predicted ATPase